MRAALFHTPLYAYSHSSLRLRPANLFALQVCSPLVLPQVQALASQSQDRYYSNTVGIGIELSKAYRTS